MTDQEIIIELRNGNTSVLRHVYKHLDKVVAYVCKNSGTEADAHDTFQDAVMVFYNNAKKTDFVLSASIGTYLYSICARMWLKKLRDNKMVLVELETSSNEQELDCFDFELNSEKEVNSSDQLIKVVNELGEPCSAILDLFYFKKISLEIIAQNLGYNSSQVVRQQKYRCLKRIKDKVKDSVDFRI